MAGSTNGISFAPDGTLWGCERAGRNDHADHPDSGDILSRRAENIAISADDRTFISSASDSIIVEVLTRGQLRTVVPGQFELAGGVGVIGNRVDTAHIGGIVSWNRTTREQTSVFRSAFGVADFPATTSFITRGRNLILMSSLGNEIVVWNPRTNTSLARAPIEGPTDAEVFRGDLLVTQANGQIFRLTSNLELIDVVATFPGATGLTSKGSDVHAADHIEDTVVRISDLIAPECIDIGHNTMFVVEAGSQSLTRSDMRTGRRTTIATDLGIQAPTIFPIRWSTTWKPSGTTSM